ncbi:MAG: Hsp20/alpha crystallin family protein [Spirochaetota bacterium]
MIKFPISNFWNEMLNLQTEVERVFTGYSDRREFAYPATNIKTDEDSVHVTAQIPGFTKEELNIQVEGQILEISGEKKESKDENTTWQQKERRISKFVRKFRIPVEVAAESTEAKLENGILTLTLPVKEESKAKKITIQGSK